MSDLRKQVRVEICGEEIALPVNMSIIETIERVYNVNVNFAVVSLQNPAKIKLTDLAEVYLSWITPGHLSQLGKKRQEIREFIYTADLETIDRLSGAVMGAALYFRKDISGEDMEALAKGRSLDGKEELSLDEKKPLSGQEQAPNSTE